MFGKVDQGIHSYRIFNIAIVDVLMTVIAAFLIHYFAKINFFVVLILLFLLGIICHRVFCVHTTIDNLLFGP